MRTNVTYDLLFAPFRIWHAYAWRVGELALASGQVIYRRTHQLSSPGQIPAEYQRELFLMGQEKFAAAADSARAMALGYWTVAPQLAMVAARQMAMGFAPFPALIALNPFEPWSRQANAAHQAFARSAAVSNQVYRSVAKIASRGLKPVRARVRANARRLKRKVP